MKTKLLSLAFYLLNYILYSQTYATLPFTDNFTSGGTSLNNSWTTSFTNSAGRIEQRNEVGNWPKFTLNNGVVTPSGKGMTIYNTSNLSTVNKLSALLHVNAENATSNVILNFNVVDWGTGIGTNQCMDSLKLYLSVNGGISFGTTYSLVNLSQSPHFDGTWNNTSVDISQLATNNSLILSDSTVIKFVFNLKGSGDTTSPKTGNQMIYIDNLSVTEEQGSPVELISFEAINKDDCNVVTWSTATEINNNYFTLERSEDGYTFYLLDTIKGNNGCTRTNYSYTDRSIYKTYYYRLKQTDFDGSFEDLGIEVVTIRNEELRSLKFIFNVEGKIVNENETGLIFKVYSDGTIEKIIK